MNTTRRLLHLLVLSLFALTSPKAGAFYLAPNQIIRFQSNVLKNSQPFGVKGALTIHQKKYQTFLNWTAPLVYSLTITGVDPAAYTEGSGSEKWTLVRDGRTCNFKTDSQTFSCPSAQFWALLELGGHSDLTVKSLRANKLIKEEDIAYVDLNVKKISETPVLERRSQLTMGFNGASPIAAIEIHGEDFQDDKEAGQNSYPLLQFDQRFLFPLLARNMMAGDLVTWKAAANLEVSREHNRFAHILASRVELFVGKDSFALFSRQAEGSYSKAPRTSATKNTPDLSVFKATLSEQGQNTLRALLLTH